MNIMDVGRICVKIAGRKAGHKCVIVDLIDENFVLATGPKDVTEIKRGRVNVKHIEPTKETVKILRGASDDDVAKALEAAGKIDEMRQLVKPL